MLPRFFQWVTGRGGVPLGHPAPSVVVIETDATRRYAKAAEPDRVMASIVVIAEVNDIPDAHSIQVATVGGWEVVIKKHEFVAGDEAILWSLDSVLDPLNANTAHLEAKRLKTVRLRKQLSQGFLGSKEWLRDYGEDPTRFKVGDNVTIQMRVRKYIAAGEAENNEDARRGKTNRFPEHWVPKTDETRIQNRISLAAKIIGQPVVISVKEEGTSTTALHHHSFKGTSMLCGRNTILYSHRHHQGWLESQMLDIASSFVNGYYSLLSALLGRVGRRVNYSGNYCVERKNNEHYFALYEQSGLEKKLVQLGRNLALQMETVGPKINGNRMNLTEVATRVFKAFDMDQRYYLGFDELLDVCSHLDLPPLRVYFRGIMPDRIDDLIRLSTPTFLSKKKFKTLEQWRTFHAAKFENVPVTTKSLLQYVAIFDYDEGFPAEGAVIFLDMGKEAPRTSFKVVSNRFLEKHVKEEDLLEELATSS